jgi:ring-1,2-phenylacetyl-CoA epoxidase subunit PaaD
VIRDRIAARLDDFGLPVRVDTTFEVPWTSERISPAGRRALAAVGIAPPSEPDAVRCPFCASGSVVMDSAFGPTQCRSLYYCRACRQPFEALKPV